MIIGVDMLYLFENAFMKRRKTTLHVLERCLLIAVGLAALLSMPIPNFAAPTPRSTLDNGWTNPPNSARLRAYWWWLNGNVTRESITCDLEQMKAKGFGGAVIIDAGDADQWGNARVPHGPTFFTPNLARTLPARAAGGRPARSRNKPQHPERLESRRTHGHGG
jgi:hypothetical protein